MTDHGPDTTMSIIIAAMLVAASLSAAGCRGSQSPDAAAAGVAALPPTDVMTVTLEPKPVPRAS